MSVSLTHQTAMNSAVRHLVTNYNPKGNRVGWLMMSSILVEAWDLYSIAFVLVFIRNQYHPDPLMLGLAAAGTQGGALVGAIIGGWLSDKIGRRVMFLSTMIMFIVFALLQAVVPDVFWLVIVRFILGVPLGSDISNGYTYIMESMPKGEREIMGNRWQFMFAIGEVITLAVIAVFLVADMPPEWIWRVTLGLGALPALIILLLRHDLPETAVWLIRHGRFREAKQVSLQILQRQSADAARTWTSRSRSPASHRLPRRHPQKDPIRWRATLYGWIACFCQGSEFLHLRFLPAGAVHLRWRQLHPRHQSCHHGPLRHRRHCRLDRPDDHAEDRTSRHRHVGLRHRLRVAAVAAAAALYTNHPMILPFVAAAMLWGHYWDASNCMTIPTLVARPEYRGTASGFAYMFVKLPSFLAIFLFPSLFTAIGQAGATLFVAIFPLVGFLAAVFILPEVYGYDSDH